MERALSWERRRMPLVAHCNPRFEKPQMKGPGGPAAIHARHNCVHSTRVLGSQQGSRVADRSPTPLIPACKLPCHPLNFKTSSTQSSSQKVPLAASHHHMVAHPVRPGPRMAFPSFRLNLATDASVYNWPRLCHTATQLHDTKS